ncbi:Bifunctional protein FolD protein [uncultured archaeon]|nr:Bifunctional protein FolD protein [uncultured archaeon]
MTAVVINGTAVALRIREEVRREVEKFKAKHGFPPGLATVLVGDDSASRMYVGMKHKACGEAGFYSENHALPSSASQKDVEALVKTLNESKKIHGILVQVPLPKHLDESRILDLVSPSKDVDGFSSVNQGLLMKGEPPLVAATPKGVIRLIEEVTSIAGKNVVVINRSTIVGKPLIFLLLNRDATVTVCHSKTKNLASHTRQADILITAVGKAGIIKAGMIKPGATVIDAGTAVVDGKARGDVAFDEAKEVAGHITPVPGGVGPMTIAMLLENTLVAAKNAHL